MARALLIFLSLLLIPAATAFADDDVRRSGTCGAGVSSELRLDQRDGGIRVRFRVDGSRAGEKWRFVLVHERRVAWRGHRRTGSGSKVGIRRRIANYAGADFVSVRASGPRGNTCAASATLPGS
ncbi:MAG: hypothetical protein ACJ74L_03295 [Gaiellaceae bacterium]